MYICAINFFFYLFFCEQLDSLTLGFRTTAITITTRDNTTCTEANILKRDREREKKCKKQSLSSTH
jgi:hypothetical protein